MSAAIQKLYDDVKNAKTLTELSQALDAMVPYNQTNSIYATGDGMEEQWKAKKMVGENVSIVYMIIPLIQKPDGQIITDELGSLDIKKVFVDKDQNLIESR